MIADVWTERGEGRGMVGGKWWWEIVVVMVVLGVLISVVGGGGEDMTDGGWDGGWWWCLFVYEIEVGNSIRVRAGMSRKMSRYAQEQLQKAIEQ